MAEDKQAETYSTPTRCPHGSHPDSFCYRCEAQEAAAKVMKQRLEAAGARLRGNMAANDAVNHPSHYTAHPSGVECITVTEHMNFNVGNAIKYLWRAGNKNNLIEDLKKARWYVDREILRQTSGQN